MDDAGTATTLSERLENVYSGDWTLEAFLDSLTSAERMQIWQGTIKPGNRFVIPSVGRHVGWNVETNRPLYGGYEPQALPMPRTLQLFPLGLQLNFLAWRKKLSRTETGPLFHLPLFRKCSVCGCTCETCTSRDAIDGIPIGHLRVSPEFHGTRCELSLIHI